ncbi:MAG: hypothetical protein AB1896_17900 [Thermodesulfobacteriota bacterium]
MVRDKLFRMIALIALCAMVYYFSFDQGRDSQRVKLAKMQETLEAKERIIAKLAAEVARLKKELAGSGISEGEDTSPDLAQAGPSLRITVREGASRTLYDGRLILTCLSLDRPGKKALIQLNLLEEGRLIKEDLGLGLGLRFNLGGRTLVLVLEQLQANQMVAQIIEK